MRKFKIMGVFVIIFFCSITFYYSGKTFLTVTSGTLLPGSRNDTVKEVQQKLKNWGYYEGDISGVYDIGTFQSVKSFQQSYGMFSNGIANTDTLRAIGLTTLAGSGTAFAQSASVNKEQLLARAINGEARGEAYLGQVAVGAVILNRVKDSRFPKSIAGVIYQPGAFTAVSDGQINVPLESKSTVVKAARDALNGFDPSSGCVYYWNPDTATSKWIWSRKIVKKIGKHYFGK